MFTTLCLSHAQQPVSIELTESDGIPDIEFYNGIEDKQGFVWLAANNGLYRYDGKTFKHFTHKQQRNNAVFGTLNDTKGRIWCNNISAQFFYVADDKLEYFIDLSSEFNKVLAEFLVTDTHLIVFSAHKIIYVNLNSKEITKRLQTHQVFGAIHRKDDTLYFSKGNNIVKTDNNLIAQDSIHVELLDFSKSDLGLTKNINLTSVGDLLLCYYKKKWK